MRDTVGLFLLKCRELGVRTIFDVGANRGQFGGDVIARGWTDRLVSYEPIGVCHAELAQAASKTPNWIVAPPMALGRMAQEANINVSENLMSSSLLPVSRASTDVAMETRYVRTEKIVVSTLDEVRDAQWEQPFGLKIDTQGFELEVLEGGSQTLELVEVILLEMSLAHLYSGGAQFDELFSYCVNRGFRCIALNEGFSDPRNNEMLQVDGVFVRDRESPRRGNEA
jgi:FkbM family methyltransferase